MASPGADTETLVDDARPVADETTGTLSLSADAAAFAPNCTMADRGYCTISGCICRQATQSDHDEQQLASEASADFPVSDAEPLAFGASWADEVEDNLYQYPEATADAALCGATDSVDTNDGWGDVDSENPLSAYDTPSLPSPRAASRGSSRKHDRSSSRTQSSYSIPSSRPSPRDSSTSSPAPGRAACRFWQQGDCKFGVKCRFKHGDDGEGAPRRGYESSRGGVRGYDSPRGRSGNSRGKARARSGWGEGGWASGWAGDWSNPADDGDDGQSSGPPPDLWNIPVNAPGNDAVEDPWGGSAPEYDPWGDSSAMFAPTAKDPWQMPPANDVPDTQVESERQRYVGDLDLPPHLASTHAADTERDEHLPHEVAYPDGTDGDFMEPPGLPSRLASNRGSASPSVRGWSTPAHEEPLNQDAHNRPLDIGSWQFNRDEFLRESTPGIEAQTNGAQPADGEGSREIEDLGAQPSQSYDAIDVGNFCVPASPSSHLPPITQTIEQSELPDFGPEIGQYDDIFGCSVFVGSGGVVQNVRTAFDPDTVEISGYPPDIALEELCDLQIKFPGVREVHFEPKLCIRYATASQAETVRTTLDGYQWNGHTLGARLDMSRVVEPAEHDGCKVEVSCPYPKLSAWIYMESMTKARKMEADFQAVPRYLGGWKVTVTVQKRPRSLIALKMDNLPTTATDEDVRTLCLGYPVTTRTMNKPSYRGDALENVKQLLDPDGEHRYLSFIRLPDGEPSTICRALVEFREAADASAAVAKLNGTHQSFLGKDDKLRLRAVAAYRCDIPRRNLDALQPALVELPQAQGSKILFGNTNFGSRIVVTGTDPRSTVIARLKVEKLLRGHVVRRKDADAWHDFFVTPPGAKILQEFDGSPVIVADRRLRQLRILGTTPDTTIFKKAQAALNGIIKALESGRDQAIIELTYCQLAYVVSGGLKRLRNRFGDSQGTKLIFHPNNRALVVRGKAEFRDSVREAVETLPARERPREAHRQCPVCTGKPEEGRPLPCGHEYCLTCLQHFLRTGVGEPFTPLACIYAGCEALVPQSMIKDKLSNKDAKALIEAAALDYVHAHPTELRFCPTGCEILYRPMGAGLILRCPTCRERICASCGVLYHEGMTCSEYRYESGTWASVGS
ncbi:hypothetical protein HDZ31DRAFT_60800 [Schizophyllum fasciatum]